MRTKYRICKNKYGWYKIQVFTQSTKINKWYELPYSLFVLFLAWFGFESLFQEHFWEYRWENSFDQTLYKTKESVEKEISKWLEDEQERSERNNNAWECQGEY